MQNEVYRVMAVDALASSHPLSSPADEVNTPAQISELFDSITYSKVLLGGPESRGLWGGIYPAGNLSTAAALGMSVPGSQLGLLSSLSPYPREPQSSGCCPVS